MPFKTEVLDPHLCTILPEVSTKYLPYPHETILLVLQGNGEVIINNTFVSIEPQSILYIPRWTPYKIKNHGDTILSIMTITDQGLTSRLPISSSSMNQTHHEISKKIH